jgi:hypothetical protein
MALFADHALKSSNVAFLLLLGKFGQHMMQPLGCPASMKPQIGLHDATASSMSFQPNPVHGHF